MIYYLFTEKLYLTHIQKIQIILHLLKIVLVDLIGVKKPICNDSKVKVLLPNHLLPIGISSKLLYCYICNIVPWFFKLLTKKTKYLQPWYYVKCNEKLITKIRLLIFYRGYNFSEKNFCIKCNSYIYFKIYYANNTY